MFNVTVMDVEIPQCRESAPPQFELRHVTVLECAGECVRAEARRLRYEVVVREIRRKVIKSTVSGSWEGAQYLVILQTFDRPPGLIDVLNNKAREVVLVAEARLAPADAVLVVLLTVAET